MNIGKDGIVNETFKRVKHLQNGGIIIECHNEKQHKKLGKVFENQNKFQTKSFNNTEPTLMISGIEKGYQPEEFIKELIEDNPQIKDIFGEDVITKIKYVTKKECRNKYKENWVLQTKPDIFKWLLKNENLCFDLMKAYVYEYTNLAMCFKCCYFGHVAKYCKGTVCCYKCGKEHESNQCPGDNPLDCVNCKRMKLEDRIHSARDPKCPAYLHKLEKYRQNTDFGESETNKNVFLERK